MARRPTVAYQGAPGAFSHEACLRLVPHDEVFELPRRPREHKPYEFFVGTGIPRRQSLSRRRGIRRRF